MRCLAVMLLVGGCALYYGDNQHSDPDAKVPIPDAAPCSGGPSNQPVPGCVYGALDALMLDGMWTFTGTDTTFGTTSQVKKTMYIKRRGSGDCSLEISDVPLSDTQPLAGYSDNTIAWYSYHTISPHTHDSSWQLCVRDSDQALHYTDHVYVSMPPYAENLDGVLTR